MDRLQTDALRRYRPFLVTNVVYESIEDKLHESLLLSDEEMRDIKAEDGNTRKMRRLLDTVQRSQDSSEPFQEFLDILRTSGYVAIAKNVEIAADGRNRRTGLHEGADIIMHEKDESGHIVDDDTSTYSECTTYMCEEQRSISDHGSGCASVRGFTRTKYLSDIGPLATESTAKFVFRAEMLKEQNDVWSESEKDRRQPSPLEEGHIRDVLMEGELGPTMQTERHNTDSNVRNAHNDEGLGGHHNYNSSLPAKSRYLQNMDESVEKCGDECIEPGGVRTYLKRGSGVCFHHTGRPDIELVIEDPHHVPTTGLNRSALNQRYLELPKSVDGTRMSLVAGDIMGNLSDSSNSQSEYTSVSAVSSFDSREMIEMIGTMGGNTFQEADRNPPLSETAHNIWGRDYSPEVDTYIDQPPPSYQSIFDCEEYSDARPQESEYVDGNSLRDVPVIASSYCSETPSEYPESSQNSCTNCCSIS